MNWRRHRVTISNHAWERWQERANPKIKRAKLVKLVTAKLNAALGVGMPLDNTGAGWLRIKHGLWACVRLTSYGWEIKTFIIQSTKKAVV